LSKYTFQFVETRRWQPIVSEFVSGVPERFHKFLPRFTLQISQIAAESGRSTEACLLSSDWCKSVAYELKTAPKAIMQELVAAWNSKFPMGQAHIAALVEGSGELLLSLAPQGRRTVFEEGGWISNDLRMQHVVVAPLGRQLGSLERLRFLAEAWMQYRIGLEGGFPAALTNNKGEPLTSKELALLCNTEEAIDVEAVSAQTTLSKLRTWLEKGEQVTLWCTQRSFSSDDYREICGLASEFPRLTVRCGEVANRTREAKLLAGGAINGTATEGQTYQWFSGNRLLYLLGETINDGFDPSIVELQESANLGWLIGSTISRVERLMGEHGLNHEGKALQDWNSSDLTHDAVASLSIIIACFGGYLERAIRYGDVARLIGAVELICNAVLKLCNDPAERLLMHNQKSDWRYWPLLIAAKGTLELSLDFGSDKS
jgi:hypothetical protein